MAHRNKRHGLRAAPAASQDYHLAQTPRPLSVTDPFPRRAAKNSPHAPAHRSPSNGRPDRTTPRADSRLLERMGVHSCDFPGRFAGFHFLQMLANTRVV